MGDGQAECLEPHRGRPRLSGLTPIALVLGGGEALRWKEMAKDTLTYISSLKGPPYLAERGPGVEIGWGFTSISKHPSAPHVAF